MAYLVSAYCFSDVLGFLLVVELGRMHTNDHDRPAVVLFLHPFQIRQGVHTVDAAISPKVKDNNVTFQVLFKRKGPVGVEPCKAIREILRF